jgi:TldD protein
MVVKRRARDYGVRAYSAVKEIAHIALAELRTAGAEYADARATERSEELYVARGDHLSVETSEEHGVAVRAFVGSAWGFAFTSELTEEAVQRAAREAVAAAKASAFFGPASPGMGSGVAGPVSFAHAVLRDPFYSRLGDKIDLVKQAIAAMRRAKAVRVAKCRLRFLREHTVLATSEGITCERTVPLVNAGAQAIAVKGGRFEVRTTPAVGGGIWAGGMEVLERVRLVELAGRAAAEAEALLDATPCPAGKKDLVLDPWLTARLLHETLGHALCGDGPSFIGPAELGKRRVGSRRINLYQDPALLGSPGTLGFDDEGTAPREVTLVHQGIVAGVLSDRQQAKVLGIASTGAARAADFRAPPEVRMTNLVLGVGHGDAHVLAGEIDGLYLEGARAISFDARRAHFRLSAEVAWEVRRGQRGRLLRGAVLGGSTAGIWQACDAVGGAEARPIVGLWCETGQPPRRVAVGHRVPAVRLRQVAVGSTHG